MAEQKDNQLRLPPQSIEAELAVLGSMMIDNEAVPKAINMLKAESFYKSAHAKIFDCMIELFDKAENIDTVTVIDKLKKKKDLDTVGGAYFITGLANEAPSAENIEYYTKIVQEKYVLRKIIKTSIEMNTAAYEGADDVPAILDRAEEKLFNLSSDSLKGGFEIVEPILHKVLDKLSDSKKGAYMGVPSGIRKLDDLLSGFHKSDLIVLAGRPSMGKTAMALAMARNAAIDYGHKIALFSLEMSSMQLVERLITSEAELDSHAVRSGKLPKSQWKKLAQAAAPISEAKFYIDDSATLNVLEIRAKARRLKAEKDIDILFVDYLQLINGTGRSESRQQEISVISRSLKALAKELDIPVVALSQLSRAPEQRTDHRPVMSDLRESGAIEQDADVVIFVYRKFVYSKNEEDKGIAELIVGKHRNGPTGVVPVAFIDKYAKFGDLASYGDNHHGEEVPY
jgi:replicative DNA helicase